MVQPCRPTSMEESLKGYIFICLLECSTITSCVTMNPNMSIYRRLNPKPLVQAGMGLDLLHWANMFNIYCKIEFIQPSCWLYFVPNLLVFQQLVTLYLGGFVVRVVSEIEC